MPEGRSSIEYPSLPEPYINLFFPVDGSAVARVKGISSRSDFLEVTTPLFGVRLYLEGWFRLHLAPCAYINNRLASGSDVGIDPELVASLAGAGGFDERVRLFLAWYDRRAETPIDRKKEDIAAAFQYLVAHYRDPSVISDYAESSGFNPRTISRWFSDVIGIGPKKLARIARFHTALSSMHEDKEPGFYFDCGYYDQAHFIREFREFTGLSPEEYYRRIA